jgi:hypothetical protein
MADIEQDVRKDVQFQTAVDFDHRDPKAGMIMHRGLLVLYHLLRAG